MNQANKPRLSTRGLNYSQYIALHTVWDSDGVTVGTHCENKLHPLLKRYESQAHIKTQYGEQDEPQVFIHLTNHCLAH